MSTTLTLTVEEAARALGIGRSLAYELARRGELPTLRLGRRLLVSKAALDRMLSSIEGQAAPADGDGGRAA
jgi:excisionase family DNA binding protein